MSNSKDKRKICPNTMNNSQKKEKIDDSSPIPSYVPTSPSYCPESNSDYENSTTDVELISTSMIVNNQQKIESNIMIKIIPLNLSKADFQLEVKPIHTILFVKLLSSDLIDELDDDIILHYKGKELADIKTMDDYGIKDGDILLLTKNFVEVKSSKEEEEIIIKNDILLMKENVELKRLKEYQFEKLFTSEIEQQLIHTYLKKTILLHNDESSKSQIIALDDIIIDLVSQLGIERSNIIADCFRLFYPHRIKEKPYSNGYFNFNEEIIKMKHQLEWSSCSDNEKLYLSYLLRKEIFIKNGYSESKLSKIIRHFEVSRSIVKKTLKNCHNFFDKFIKHQYSSSSSMNNNNNNNNNEIEIDETDCSICAEGFTNPVKLSCCHIFCQKCIEKWKKESKKCPICRQEITGMIPIELKPKSIKLGKRRNSAMNNEISNEGHKIHQDIFGITQNFSQNCSTCFNLHQKEHFRKSIKDCFYCQEEDDKLIPFYENQNLRLEKELLNLKGQLEISENLCQELLADQSRRDEANALGWKTLKNQIHNLKTMIEQSSNVMEEIAKNQ